MTQQIFSAIGPSGVWDSANYLGPVGSFAGNDALTQASVLFMPTYPMGVDQRVWGNMDAAAFKGWEIGITAAGLIRARVGDGSALHSVTFDPAGRLLRHWFFAILGYATGSLALWINGTLVGSLGGISSIAPAVGQAVVGGADAAFATPYSGLIAGVAYTEPGSSIGVDPFAAAIDVARTGQVSLPDTSSAIPTQPQYSWQVPFYNEAAAASWAPSTGGVALTRNGDTSLVLQNAPANAWF
jgi:hypothetical protein